MDYWDRELTKLFISVFKECPCLYSRRHEDYKNQTKRNEKTELILNELKVFCPELTLRDIKKKIRHLKGQFSKEKSKIVAGEKNGPVWWCFKDLQFLNQSNDTSRASNHRASKSPDHAEMIQKSFTELESLCRTSKESLGNIKEIQSTILEISKYTNESLKTIERIEMNDKAKATKSPSTTKQGVNVDNTEEQDENVAKHFEKPKCDCYFFEEEDIETYSNSHSSDSRNSSVTLTPANAFTCEGFPEQNIPPRVPNTTYSELAALTQKTKEFLENIYLIENRITELLKYAEDSFRNIQKTNNISDATAALLASTERGINLNITKEQDQLLTKLFEELNCDGSHFDEKDLEIYPNSQIDNQQSGGPHRVRNILTLQERVRAIEAYDRRPMYTKVASMFNCSWEQIKNIISNRKAIMDFYDATKTNGPVMSPDQEIIRQRKIAFLGECIYEYIQRAQFHAKATINEEIIRMKAIEFRELIQIESFLPNKAWLNQFKNTYNISLSQGQIVLMRTPPGSLDLKNIMTYCSRNKPADVPQQQPVIRNMYKMTTTMAVDSANKATVEELKQRRLRKINFMGKALYEYIQRSQYHHKTTIDEDILHKVACELKDMLKIDNFYPTKKWLNDFRTQCDFSAYERPSMFTRTPPLSLDLKDILSYCSRIDQKNAKVSSTNVIVPRESEQVKRAAAAIEKKIQEQRLASQYMVVQSVVRPEIITATNLNEVGEDIKPNISQIKIEPHDPTFTDDNIEKPPPLKMLKIESVEQTEDTLVQSIPSPGHWSEHSSEDEELPKHVTNYNEALKLLKPLEEFAMLEENYRAIGMISQLENLFKNPPHKSD